MILWLVKLLLAFVLLSIGWVILYRFVNPPITFTMLGDAVAGRGVEKDWMSLDRIDRDVVRAVIGGEDSKFCSHAGFDLDAISEAARRNASGGRIRGGSTISQQTAKNAFLWQGGGYVRKGVEAWFTLLIEQLWGKRRIMEVYLNIAETGIGTYGVSAGARRHYGHDASALSRSEAARLAAVLPLPKGREAIAPRGFTRRYGNTIIARIGVVARDGLDACVYAGTVAPRDRTPPPSRKPAILPGADVETAPASPVTTADQLDRTEPQVSAPPSPSSGNEPPVVEEVIPAGEAGNDQENTAEIVNSQ